MALQLQLPFPRSHQEAVRRLLDARDLACDLDPYTKLQAVCHAPLIALFGTPIVVRYAGNMLVMFHPGGRIDLDIGEKYHWRGAHEVIRRCLPLTWGLVRRRNRLILAHTVPGADGTAVTMCYDWPSNGSVTLTAGGLFLLELTATDTRGAADDQVPEDSPPLRQEIDGQAPTAPPARISDARWAEYNRKFNELLMRRSD